VVRFFINKTIEALANVILQRHGLPGERAMLLPSRLTAHRCVDFFRQQAPQLEEHKIRVLNFESSNEQKADNLKYAPPKISAVLFPGGHWPIAKTYWQHTGEGVSSRQAEYCHELLKAGMLTEKKEDATRLCKGPRRYRDRKSLSTDLSSTTIINTEAQDSTQFIEERFGRNLELQFVEKAKSAIKRRIAGSLTADVPLEDALDLEQDQARKRDVAGFSEDDIYLYPCGMNAVFNAHRTLLAARGAMKSVMYGCVWIRLRTKMLC
jgi:cystathionine gamma-synthase